MHIVPSAVASVFARVRGSPQPREPSRSRANSTASSVDVPLPPTQLKKALADIAPAAETETQPETQTIDTPDNAQEGRKEPRSSPTQGSLPSEEPELEVQAEEPVDPVDDRMQTQTTQDANVSDCDEDPDDGISEMLSPNSFGLGSLSLAERQALRRPRAPCMLTPIRELSIASTMERSNSGGPPSVDGCKYTASEIQAIDNLVRSMEISKSDEALLLRELTESVGIPLPSSRAHLDASPAAAETSQTVALDVTPNVPAILESEYKASPTAPSDSPGTAHIAPSSQPSSPSAGIPEQSVVPPHTAAHLPLPHEPARSPSPRCGSRTFLLAMEAVQSNPQVVSSIQPEDLRSDMLSQPQGSSSEIKEEPLKLPPVTVASASSDSSEPTSGAPPLPASGPILECISPTAGASASDGTSQEAARGLGPPHTAERPNWALAPSDMKTKPQRSRGSKGGRGGRSTPQRSNSKAHGNGSADSPSKSRSKEGPEILGSVEPTVQTPRLSAAAQTPLISLMGPLSARLSDPKGSAMHLNQTPPTGPTRADNASPSHARFSDTVFRNSPAPTTRSASTDSRCSLPIDVNVTAGVAQMPTDMQISVQLSYKLPSGEACVADVKRAFQVLERELLAVTLPLPPGAAISGPLILKVERAERSDSSSTLNDESAIGQVKGPLSDSNNQPTATVAPSFGPYGPIQQPAEDVSCTVQRLASQDTVDPALLPCYDRAGATVVARYVWPSMDRTRRLRALQDGLYMRAAHALKHGWQGDINGGDQRPLLKDILLSGMAAGGKVPPVDFTEASGRLYSRTVAQVQAFVASGGHSLGQSDAISASRTPAVAHDNGVASTVGSVPMPPSLAPSDALLQGPRPWNMKRQSSVPSIPGANGRDLSPQEWIVFDQNDGAQPRLAFERRANGPQPHPTGGQGYSSAAPPGSDRGFQIAGANNFDGPRTMSLKHVHFDGLRNSAPGMIGSNGLPTDYASTTAFARPDIQRARTSEQRGMSNVWPPSK